MSTLVPNAISILSATLKQSGFKNIDLFKMKKKEILEKSDKVITVSNYTKENLIKLYNVNEDKLTVIHPHLIKNKETNITEYYNLVYQYGNDCLIAALEYNKDYYNDRDVKPAENLFFKLTMRIN